MIELVSVVKEFDRRGKKTRALNNVSLQVERKQFVALVGPSGCGKSTVLNLIAGLMKPTEGKVYFDGADVSDVNHRVGYMTQRDTLLPWRNVEDNVGIALELRTRSTSPEERREQTRKLIDLVGLSGFEKHYPSELSGGMRKRTALARMLIYQPETLLLDEPFGALDAQLKLVMQDELDRLTQMQNMTTVFVTHDLVEAVALADAVAIFTGRPGHIKKMSPVPLKRPRDIQNVRFTPEFAEIYNLLWDELKDEVVHGTET